MWSFVEWRQRTGSRAAAGRQCLLLRELLRCTLPPLRLRLDPLLFPRPELALWLRHIVLDRLRLPPNLRHGSRGARRLLGRYWRWRGLVSDQALLHPHVGLVHHMALLQLPHIVPTEDPNLRHLPLEQLDGIHLSPMRDGLLLAPTRGRRWRRGWRTWWWLRRSGAHASAPTSFRLKHRHGAHNAPVCACGSPESIAPSTAPTGPLRLGPDHLPLQHQLAAQSPTSLATQKGPSTLISSP